jgi:CMP-N,N'-diacetyllegionaminic acid synthase
LVKDKTFCFDIDGVIFEPLNGYDYLDVEPIRQNIEAINKLYDSGARIILYTARGSFNNEDWEDETVIQLNRHGVKYHGLFMGKPPADFYIDDRMVTMRKIREMVDATA